MGRTRYDESAERIRIAEKNRAKSEREETRLLRRIKSTFGLAQWEWEVMSSLEREVFRTLLPDVEKYPHPHAWFAVQILEGHLVPRIVGRTMTRMEEPKEENPHYVNRRES